MINYIIKLAHSLTITHASHTNVSVIPTLMKRKANTTLLSSTGTAHGTEKLLLKTQVKVIAYYRARSKWTKYQQFFSSPPPFPHTPTA